MLFVSLSNLDHSMPLLHEDHLASTFGIDPEVKMNLLSVHIAHLTPISGQTTLAYENWVETRLSNQAHTLALGIRSLRLGLRGSPTFLIRFN